MTRGEGFWNGLKEWLDEHADYEMEVTIVNFSQADYEVYKGITG